MNPDDDSLNRPIVGISTELSHYQEVWVCALCGREVIVDLFSVGGRHQSIRGVTCAVCSVAAGGRRMGRDIEFIAEIKQAP